MADRGHDLQGHDVLGQQPQGPVGEPVVTIVFFNPICFTRWGMAVISSDFSSVATWPKAMPCSLAQTLAMCNGPGPWASSYEPRHVFPSMATNRAGALAPSVRTASANQSRKHA
ncbi:hypothetical protein R5W24_001053 [Gemmata sp. JC717]|nr:hypothetical protein [Gemmata algarum]MDY3551973.1 hypothetical protein [Gemmata algarum]